MALHCAATLLIAHPGDASWTRTLVRSLKSERVVRVWSGADPQDQACAHVAAEELAVQALALPGLDTASGGAGFREAVGHIADLHRGETVLVLSQNGPWETDAPVRLEVGDDGWRIIEPERG